MTKRTDVSQADRERLILDRLPQVRVIAHRLAVGRQLFEDLVSAGTLGLIAAVDEFKPKLGVQLKTYAEYRIRGAMLDTMRRADGAKRLARRRRKQIDVATEELRQSLQREPAGEEVAKSLGISVREYQRWRLEAEATEPVNFDGLWTAGLTAGAPPDAAAEQAELVEMLRVAMERLPRPTREVLELYYEVGLTLREIAARLSLSIPAVSKRKTIGIQLLRRSLRQPRRTPIPNGGIEISA